MTSTLPSWLALVGLAAYAIVTFGVRSWLQWRRTGSTGFRGISGRAGSAEWWGGMLLAGSMVAAPVAALLDVTRQLPPFVAAEWVRWLGLAVFGAGFAATFAAQLAMGTSWRIGVDATEVTDIVTSGPFTLVRNPIFSAMLLASLGLALVAPNALAVAALFLAFLGIELQVRLVEEPYLLRTHGATYAAYAARVGRFIPSVGRLHAQRRAPS
jgi:protein-S-isoprenylcysteine O-methyltransferase Ste14